VGNLIGNGPKVLRASLGNDFAMGHPARTAVGDDRGPPTVGGTAA
jgi:hypothetical protein